VGVGDLVLVRTPGENKETIDNVEEKSVPAEELQLAGVDAE
jgi:hypothetical protein